MTQNPISICCKCEHKYSLPVAAEAFTTQKSYLRPDLLNLHRRQSPRAPKVHCSHLFFPDSYKRAQYLQILSPHLI